MAEADSAEFSTDDVADVNNGEAGKAAAEAAESYSEA